MKVNDLMIFHDDGSIEPSQKITIQEPSGTVSFGPGVRFRKGVSFMGVDVFELLEMDV